MACFPGIDNVIVGDGRVIVRLELWKDRAGGFVMQDAKLGRTAGRFHPAGDGVDGPAVIPDVLDDQRAPAAQQNVVRELAKAWQAALNPLLDRWRGKS